MNRISQIICILLAFLLFFLSYLLLNKNKQTNCPENYYCLNKDTTVCLVLDFSEPVKRFYSGWHPVSPLTRMKVSQLVHDGKAEYWFNVESLECFDRMSTDPKILGKSVATLKMEWWRWKKVDRK